MPNRRSSLSFNSHNHTDAPSANWHDEDALSSDRASGVTYDDEAQAPTFAELHVPNRLVSVLAKDGKDTAFPIQADTLADSLAGRDLLGRGQTGSGKTLAFAIPLVARLGENNGSDAAIRSFEHWREHGDERSRRQAMLPRPRGLVMAPTRELVNQIDEVIRPLADAYGMGTVTIYGGVNQKRQVDALRDGADIIVACPGRLEDLLHQRLLSLEDVEICVLDEADEMADMGFLPAVKRLLSQVDRDGQRMLFSATLDHGVDALVREFLTDAKIHAVDAVDAQVDTMTQHVFRVSKPDKYEVIRELASGKGKRLLFTRTKYQAKKMAKKLTDAGIPAVDLQGNLSQHQRDRHLAAFSDGDVRVMVATDVAARGIDVSDVRLVVQTEPPEDSKSFLHRSGRTARAGESGDVVTLVLPEQRSDARVMLRQAGIQAKAEDITPASPVLKELVGEHAPLVKGWALPTPVQNVPGTGRRHRGSSQGRSGRSKGSSRRGGRDRGGRDERRDGYREDRRGGGTRSSDRSERRSEYGTGDTQGLRDASGRRGGDSRRGQRSQSSRTASGFRRGRGGRNAAPFRTGR